MATAKASFFSLASSRLSHGDTWGGNRGGTGLVGTDGRTARTAFSRRLSYKRRLEGQAGGDGERRVQAAENGAEQHELPDAHVHRQAGQVVAQRGQLLLGRQSSQVPQALLGCVQALGGRGLHQPAEDRLQGLLAEHVQDLDSEREGAGSVASGLREPGGGAGGKARAADPPEAELLQRNSLDLGQLLLGQLVLEAVAGEEVEADPRGHAARSALPLQRVGPGNPRVLQALHAFGSVVPAGRGEKNRV